MKDKNYKLFKEHLEELIKSSDPYPRLEKLIKQYKSHLSPYHKIIEHAFVQYFYTNMRNPYVDILRLKHKFKSALLAIEKYYFNIPREPFTNQFESIKNALEYSFSHDYIESLLFRLGRGACKNTYLANLNNKCVLSKHYDGHSKIQYPKIKKMPNYPLFQKNLIQEPTYSISRFRAKGDLDKYVETHMLTRERFTEIAYFIIASVQRFHDEGNVHLDIKPGNFLLDKAIARLSDFDGACSIQEFFFPTNQNHELLLARFFAYDINATYRREINPILQDRFSLLLTLLWIYLPNSDQLPLMNQISKIQTALKDDVELDVVETKLLIALRKKFIKQLIKPIDSPEIKEFLLKINASCQELPEDRIAHPKQAKELMETTFKRAQDGALTEILRLPCFKKSRSKVRELVKQQKAKETFYSFFSEDQKKLEYLDKHRHLKVYTRFLQNFLTETILFLDMILGATPPDIIEESTNKWLVSSKVALLAQNKLKKSKLTDRNIIALITELRALLLLVAGKEYDEDPPLTHYLLCF